MENKFISNGIELANGIKVTTSNEQNCCKSVYAEWDALKDTTFVDEAIDEVNIEKVAGSGFRINGYFVPCHNRQNGWYSDELTLTIHYTNGDKLLIDITECNEDEIY